MKLKALANCFTGKNQRKGLTKNITEANTPKKRYFKKNSDEVIMLTRHLIETNMPTNEIINRTGISRSSIRSIRLIMAAENNS